MPSFSTGQPRSQKLVPKKDSDDYYRQNADYLHSPQECRGMDDIHLESCVQGLTIEAEIAIEDERRMLCISIIHEGLSPGMSKPGSK